MTLTHLSIGSNPPEAVNVFVEIAQGSSIKYELDKESGLLKVDRFIHTAMVYPFNYGFVPHTLSEDGDPLDVLVLSAQAVLPGSILASRPIGMLEMEDESGIDTKIIAVPDKKVDPWYAQIDDVSQLDAHTLSQIRHFFTHYKELEEGKWVKIKEILGKDAALKAIMSAVKAGK